MIGRRMNIRSFSSAAVKTESDQDLAAIIKTGRGNMPGFQKKLSPEQIDQIVSYIRGLVAHT